MEVHSIKQSKQSSEKRSSKSSGVGVVRLPMETYRKIEHWVASANSVGPKRVKAKDIVRVAVEKLNQQDLEKIREELLTAQDRFEMRFADFLKDNPTGTKDDFLNHLLSGSAVTKKPFLTEQ